MIVDLSKYNGTVDWGQLRGAVDFAVLKASGLYKNGADPQYARNAEGAARWGVPFHAYHFLYCLTVEEARRDAALFFETVKAAKVWPLFWVLDCEGGWGIANSRARAVAAAFEAELRRLARERGPGEIRVAVYIAHNKYRDYALDYGRYAYVWIPRYGTNSGAPESRPGFPCDLWQYTSRGHVAGVEGTVDLSESMGTKPMEFYTTGDTSSDGASAATFPSEGKAFGAVENTVDKSNGGIGMLTGKMLAEYCEKVYAQKWVYWYGTYGQRCSSSLYANKKAQYPSHYTSERALGYQQDIAAGKRCADCVGLIKSFFWKNGDPDAEPKYGSNGCPDTNANGMIAKCSETGAIATIPEEPGLVVWKDGHIGVYVGNGWTVELKGFAYDCQRNKLSAGPWKKWGRLPATMLSYGNTSSGGAGAATFPSEGKAFGNVETDQLGRRSLIRGSRGADVVQLQRALMALGYGLPKYGADGDFGQETEKAVEAFQRDHGVPVTGIFAALSLAQLMTMLGATQEAVEKTVTASPLPEYALIIRGDEDRLKLIQSAYGGELVPGEDVALG